MLLDNGENQYRALTELKEYEAGSSNLHYPSIEVVNVLQQSEALFKSIVASIKSPLCADLRCLKTVCPLTSRHVPSIKRRWTNLLLVGTPGLGLGSIFVTFASMDVIGTQARHVLE